MLCSMIALKKQCSLLHQRSMVMALCSVLSVSQHLLERLGLNGYDQQI